MAFCQDFKIDVSAVEDDDAQSLPTAAPARREDATQGILTIHSINEKMISRHAILARW